MLQPGELKNLGNASAEDQYTIAWVLCRMQIELDAYMRQGFGEPGPAEVHNLAARKVQAYINSLLRELTATRQ